MKVKLLHYTPLEVADIAICKCYGNTPHTEESKRLNRIKRVANGFGDRTTKHSSVIEHLVYSFDIDGVSRALLQEDSRHRIGSMTVKSTRYTLQELKKEEILCEPLHPYEITNLVTSNPEIFTKYLVFTDNMNVNIQSCVALNNLAYLINLGVPNDKAKYCLPEAYKTSYVRTFNARTLQNFFQLRTDKKALWEIQLLAKAMFDALPEEHKPLFEEFIKC